MGWAAASWKLGEGVEGAWLDPLVVGGVYLAHVTLFGVYLHVTLIGWWRQGRLALVGQPTCQGNGTTSSALVRER